ncbi:GNAT family N-acetyltransferase [Streptacidiphilus neutrinimicus]|uniref:GNAT family N-acetyltransferase n=1 Tax=Streptacidiphilus neutrinimicus TaxID=105420 RepID=UPI0005A82346|nr:GNAT family N-acetyltransferase [Streptacidiphilus neutrinimicus]
MVQLTVREAVEADAGDLVRVRVDAWRAAYAGVIPPAYLDELDATAAPARLGEYLRDLPAGRHYLAAERMGRLVGFAIAGAERPSVESARGERDGFGEVHALYVHPDAWFTGAGSALLHAATHRLAEDGMHSLSLWVLERNVQARRFYERHGWRPDGARDELRFGGALVQELRYAAPAPARPLSASALPRPRRARAAV